MVTYTVKYKKVGGLFWRNIERVKGDGFVEKTLNPNNPNIVSEYSDRRWFILEDETRIEMDTSDLIFKFDKNRHFGILERMGKEAGQAMTLDKK